MTTLTVPDSGIMPLVASIEPGVDVQVMMSSALLNRPWIAMTITDTKRMQNAGMMLTVEAAQTLVDQLQALIKAATLVDDPDAVDLAELLADDLSMFPDGHPCRDCDRLAKDHPTDFCKGWR